jgi:CMP-N-acetylneuraminic acid synthetase
MELAGKPLLAYTIEAAAQSGLFSEVSVSTEDQEIARVALEYGALIPYTRPAELAGDRASVVDVTIHMIEYYRSLGIEHELVCVLLPSAPLRTAEDILGTHRALRESGSDYAMAITEYLFSPFEALVDKQGALEPFWGLDGILQKRQDRPKLWVDSGAVYFARIEAFLRDRLFYGPGLVGYRMARERAIDVDDSFTLYLARLILEDQRGETRASEGQEQ